MVHHKNRLPMSSVSTAAIKLENIVLCKLYILYIVYLLLTTAYLLVVRIWLHVISTNVKFRTFAGTMLCPQERHSASETLNQRDTAACIRLDFRSRRTHAETTWQDAAFSKRQNVVPATDRIFYNKTNKSGKPP